MVKSWKNPVFASALICGLLVYSKILPIKEKNPFSSPVPKEKVTEIFGKVVSNPVKSEFFGGTYKISFEASKVKSYDSVSSSVAGKIGVSSGGKASGITTVFIPAEIVEALYPGKLYTATEKEKRAPLIENGANLVLKVKYVQRKNMENCFLAASAEKNPFSNDEKNLRSKIVRFRSLCRLQFKRLMHAWGSAGGLLLALVSGSREYTEKDLSNAFRSAGLSHILALSGMHLSLFGGLAQFLGKKLSSKNIAAEFQFCALLFFVWFAGISPSLFRAFLSSLIIFAAAVFRINRPQGLSVLSLSFLIHIVIFPEHIFDLGFMLSYSSLAGIILLSNSVKKIIHPVIPFKLRSSLGDSASAQLATAPVALKFFGKIMPVGIFASIVVSPLVVLFLYFGLFGMALCLALPFLNVPISAIMNGVYKIIKLLVLNFSRFS